MNTSRPFWIMFGILTAVAVHLAYILFVPASQLKDQTARLIDEAGANKLLIAERGNAAMGFAEFPGELVYAVCAFDLASGPLVMRAQVPDQYWSIDIYGPRGDTVYTLNDQQAPRKQLSIELHDADPDPQAIVNAANSTGRNMNAITVLTGTRTGIVVLRSAGAGPVEQQTAIEAFKASACSVTP